MRAVFTTSMVVLLGGCATFGTNVEGSFSCNAPDGICAPATAIDDAALASIEAQGDGVELFAPIGDAPVPTIGQGGLLTAALDENAEQGLRIVFPAHRDANGVAHARREVVVPTSSSRGSFDPRLVRAPRAGLLDIAQAAPTLAAVSAKPKPLAIITRLASGSS